MRGFRKLLSSDLKLYLREPAASFFILIFPMLILVIGGYSFGQEKALTTDGGVVMRVVDLMLPSTLAWVIATQGLLGVYPVLTSMRESKVLKYYRTHPITAWHILLSQYVVGLIMLGISMVLLGATGYVLFSIRSDAHMLAFLCTLVVAYSSFFAMGFALAAVTPTHRMAQALGSLIFFPMLFLGGSFGPRNVLPPALKLLSDLSPLSHANDLLTALWVTGAHPFGEVMSQPLPFFGVELFGKTWLHGVTPWHALAYLSALAVLTSILAVRTFRWSEETSKAGRTSAPEISLAPKDAVVWARNLRKSYGKTHAVDGLDLDIKQGEIFGLLGPNGAGKTTTVEILEGLRSPDEGTARVLGLDPQREARALTYRIGVQLQEASLPSRLKVRELLDLFAAFYPSPMDADTLLDRLDLREQANVFFGKLSGGQKQRVFAALALINNPEMVFLDEITTGLDPAIRRRIWGFLRELRHAGKTILLTTHYLEEAQALCDRVLILRQGKPIAEGEPMHLIERLGARFRLEIEVDTQVDPSLWENIPNVVYGQASDGLLTFYVTTEEALDDVLAALRRNGVAFNNLRLQPVSLEDVFLVLTKRENFQEVTQ